MANTTTTRGQATSWTDFYESKRSEIASLKAVFDEPFKSFNDITSEMKEGVDLAMTMASGPYNFLILTSGSNQVNLLHHCYNTTKTGHAAGVQIGIYRIRRSSPFKAFDPTQAMLVLQPPARPKKNDNKLIPSLEMFLKAKTDEELESLEGDNQDKKVNSLKEWPNCFLAHPNIYIQSTELPMQSQGLHPGNYTSQSHPCHRRPPRPSKKQQRGHQQRGQNREPI
jgi:hypothetical protein